MALSITKRARQRSKAGAFNEGKGWRKSIGKKLGSDGRMMPARFWLGMDEHKATAAALQIESLWFQQSRPYWTSEGFTAAEGIRVGLTQENAPQQTPTAPVVKMPMTVKQGIERYRQAALSNPRLSKATKHSIRCRTASLERSPIGGMPLSFVGAEQLTALVHHWLEQPPAPKTGEPISPTSARLIVRTAHAVFDWLDGVGLWESPRRFDRIFRLPRTDAAPNVQTFTVEELARLYRAADSRMKLLILLSLNCGFCSMECATLKRAEIDLASKVIRRPRQKTQVAMEWMLWAETANLLAKHLSESGIALLTDGGKPLVWYSDGGHRIDTIVHCWTQLTKRAEINHKPFKFLRKTGATMIRSIAGVETSEQYLAHSERSMARFYSLPDPARLVAALSTMREQLQPMFAAE